MCLAIPGKIIDIFERSGIRMGKVDFGGVSKDACLAYVPDAEVGDYCVIHVGFALSLLGEEEALASLSAIDEIMQTEVS